MPELRPKIRKPLAGVIPKLRNDKQGTKDSAGERRFRAFLRERRTHLIEERFGTAWFSVGTDGLKGYILEFKKFSLDPLKIAKQILSKTGKIKIAEFGMGVGVHVPELFDYLRNSVPTGNVEYLDLSLTKAYSNRNSKLLELEKQGTVKRYVGVFEIRPLTEFRNSNLVISLKGPLFHVLPAYLVDGLKKVVSVLSHGGYAFISLQEVTVDVKRFLERLKHRGFEYGINTDELGISFLTVHRI